MYDMSASRTATKSLTFHRLLRPSPSNCTTVGKVVTFVQESLLNLYDQESWVPDLHLSTRPVASSVTTHSDPPWDVRENVAVAPGSMGEVGN
jgi:hypothetical protein